MPAFKPLPTEPDELRDLLAKLKDKELKLEADLAIRDHSPLEDEITTIALAMGELKKIDAAAYKHLSCTENLGESEVALNLAVAARIKLDAAMAVLGKKTDKGKLLVENKLSRRRALLQLSNSVDSAQEQFKDANLDMKTIIPSVTNFVKGL